jgi:hypothetical protein
MKCHPRKPYPRVSNAFIVPDRWWVQQLMKCHPRKPYSRVSNAFIVPERWWVQQLMKCHPRKPYPRVSNAFIVPDRWLIPQLMKCHPWNLNYRVHQLVKEGLFSDDEWQYQGIIQKSLKVFNFVVKKSNTVEPW